MNKTQLFLKKHSPMILTVVGTAGVGVTTVLAVKATPKALQLLEEARKEKGEDLTKLEVVKAAWKPYIPAAVTGVSTIFCIFGANYLSHKTNVSLVSAYTVLDNAYKEYRNSVSTLYGEEADKIVKNEITKSKYEEKPIEVENEEELFFEPITMQFFESTMDEVLRAEAIFMTKYTTIGGGCVNDYLHLLGLPGFPGGEQLGWSLLSANDVYGYDELDFDYEQVEMSNGLKCWNIIPTIDPVEGYIFN